MPICRSCGVWPSLASVAELAVLRFVVALWPEARPIVEHFRLTRDLSAGAFEMFRGDDVALVVSGIGKVAAAAATSYLFAISGARRQALWLNVGIAGHATEPPGAALLAHKLRDRASSRSWYPPLVFTPPCATAEVVTVDTVERGFPDDAAYEMEASGFYPIASRFATAELVHCLKVVSDGPGSDLTKLTGERVSELIGAQMASIVELASAGRALAEEARQIDADPPGYSELRRQHRFTVSETRELRRLLGRWHAAARGRPWSRPCADVAGRELAGSEVLRRLGADLASLPVDIG